MRLSDVSRRDIIKLALEALPHSNEGHAVVVVDVRDGSVEALSKTQEFENWAKNFDHKKVILHLKEEEAVGTDFESLYRKYKHEICCRIMEIKEMYPHLA